MRLLNESVFNFFVFFPRRFFVKKMIHHRSHPRKKKRCPRHSNCNEQQKALCPGFPSGCAASVVHKPKLIGPRMWKNSFFYTSMDWPPKWLRLVNRSVLYYFRPSFFLIFAYYNRMRLPYGSVLISGVYGMLLLLLNEVHFGPFKIDGQGGFTL